MGRKYQWYKMDAAAYLADTRILDLSWAERGVLQAVWCWIWRQPDDPGVAIINGNRLDFDALLGAIRLYTNRKRGAKGTRAALKRILSSGLIKQMNDGTYYSSRITQDYEFTESRKPGGQARKQKMVTTMVTTKSKDGYAESESESEIEKESERARARDTSESHAALKGKDLIAMLANKLTVHRFKKGD